MAKVLNPDAPDDEPVDVLIEDGIPDGSNIEGDVDVVVDKAAPANPDAPEAGLAALKSQLDEATRTAATAKAEAIRLARENEALNTHVAGAEKTALEKEIEGLSADYEEALNTGDYSTATKINVNLAKAAAKLDRLGEDRQPARQQQPVDQFEQWLSNFTPASAGWFREHPDAAAPDKFNRVQVYHGDAISEGIAPESPEYFAFINERMGYAARRAPAPAAEARPEPASRQPAARSYAAPVSRGEPTGSRNGTVIRLTAGQREAARASGLTDAEYASELVKLQASGEVPRH